MSVLRVRKSENFVSIDKRFLEDPNLSLKLKGFLAYCLSKPNDWEFYVRQMASVLKESKTALYSVINEGIQFGYIIRSEQRIENGRFSGCDYEIFELPQIKNISTVSQNPDADVQEPENVQLLKNYCTKNDLTKNNCNVERPKSTIDDTPSTTSQSEKENASRYLFSKKKEVYEMTTVPDFSKWNIAMDRLNRIDKRSWEEIKQMIDWVFDHDFWCKNIQCPSTLRKQWDKIMMQRVATPIVSMNVSKNISLFEKFREGLASKGLQNYIKIEGKYLVARGKDYSLAMNPSELWRSVCETFNVEFVPA